MFEDLEACFYQFENSWVFFMSLFHKKSNWEFNLSVVHLAPNRSDITMWDNIQFMSLSVNDFLAKKSYFSTCCVLMISKEKKIIEQKWLILQLILLTNTELWDPKQCRQNTRVNTGHNKKPNKYTIIWAVVFLCNYFF